MSWSDEEVARYARQVMVRDFGAEGQAKLRGAHITIIGLGGIGSPVALYLAAAGIGRLSLYDDDTISRSNLARQVLYSDADIDRSKTEIAAARLCALNPHIAIETHGTFDEGSTTDATLIIDGTDSFAARSMINARAAALGIPLLAAGLAQWEGQIALYDPARTSGCYACLYPANTDMSAVPNCAEAGVIGPLAGWIGTLAALEALKYITDHHALTPGEMLLVDGLYREIRKLNVKPHPDCPICAKSR